MDINKAIKVTKLLQHKEQLEEFFNNIQEFDKIRGIVVQINVIDEQMRMNPCVARIDPEIILPCLKEQLEAIKRGIDNM